MPGVCPRCLREVYFAEEKLALGKVWHIFCFSCRNCRKLLDSWTVVTHSGELFCRNCYSRLYSTTSVRPSFPVLISPIFSSVDKTNLAVSPRESLSDCCCCCYCDENCTNTEATNQNLELLVGSSNCSSEKQRLRGGGGCDEEKLEADISLELGDDTNALCSDTDISLLDLRSSQTTICDQPSSPPAITAWYNKHHSASQSTFSHPTSAHQNYLRPSSTPASGESLNNCNPCNSNCLSNRRPGGSSRTNYKHREHSKQCHRHNCHEFQRSDRITVSQEQINIDEECRERNVVQNSRNDLRKSAYSPHHTSPPTRKRVSFLSSKKFPLGSPATCYSAMQNISDNECKNVDTISFEHPDYHGNADEENNSEINIDSNTEINEYHDVTDDCEEDARMRGGCGGGGGGSGCCCSSGGRPNSGLDHSGQSPCSKGYRKERSSTIEGACGCSGRGKIVCGSSANSTGGCCSSRSDATSHHSPRIGGCCGTNLNDSDEGACASKCTAGSRLTGYETCPPRSPNSCTTDPSSLPSCSAAACSPPCSGRKTCCPPAGCKPVKRRIVRCNAPCTGDTQSCGGGGSCGSGCRGGCGKPGQTCLPLRPCTIPPCQPHPQVGGSPCMPPRACPPKPPCCRIPTVLGSPSSRGGGGSSCCRSGSPGARSVGGGSCPPSNSCQRQDDIGSCCQTKLPAGCECLGGGQDCQRCGRKVYQAEMQIASGVPYHNICFSCFCCRKPLETLTYHENCGEIYCKQCYVRNFGPQGYGYSGVLQTPM